MTTCPVLPDHAHHILVASPNTQVRQQIMEMVSPRAYHVESASGGAEALIHLENGHWQVLLLDRRLPDLDAEELTQTVRRRFPAVEVMLLESDSDTTAGAASPDSASPWPGLPAPLSSLPQSDTPQWNCGAAQHDAGSTAADRGPAALPGMVGNSPAMQSVHRLVNLVAARDTTVLITGPTGSGKELVARALHQLSPRAARQLSVVNCAAIPETMLEAELFGYTRGAFTGALQSYAGRIQTAHLGTLFLDEIGDMPLSLQPKVLRFLDQKELQRLGSAQVVKVDARVVAASNADLVQLVRQGRFREDLYYRLAAFPIVIPPLAERPGDVRELAAHFLQKFSGTSRVPAISEEALALLQKQSWPGSVRELQNVIERALILADGAHVIRAEHLVLSRPETRAIGHSHLSKG